LVTEVIVPDLAVLNFCTNFFKPRWS